MSTLSLALRHLDGDGDGWSANLKGTGSFLYICGEGLAKRVNIPRGATRLRLELTTNRPTNDKDYFTVSVADQDSTYGPSHPFLRLDGRGIFISGGVDLAQAFTAAHKVEKFYAYFTYLPERKSK